MILFFVLLLIGYYSFFFKNTSPKTNENLHNISYFHKFLDKIRTNNLYKHQYIENADYIKQQIIAFLPIDKKSQEIEDSLNKELYNAIEYAKHNKNIEVNMTMSPLIDPIIKPSNYYEDPFTLNERPKKRSNGESFYKHLFFLFHYHILMD